MAARRLVDVIRLFNGCSTAVQRLFNGCSAASGGPTLRPGDFLFVLEGDPRLSQRIRGTGNDAHPVHTGCATGGFFEGLAEMAAGKELTEDERTEFYLSHDNHSL